MIFEFLWDPDAWWVKRKISLVLGAFAVFFVSMFMSCQEARYMISGKTVDAPAGSDLRVAHEHGVQRRYRALTYSYQDGDVHRQNSVEVPVDWPAATQPTVKVQYIPGGDTSRLAGEHNTVWVCVFLGSLAVCALGVVVLAKSAGK